MTEKDEQKHHVVIYVDSSPIDSVSGMPRLEMHDPSFFPVPDAGPGVKRYRIEFDIPVNLRQVDADVEGVAVTPAYPDWVTPYFHCEDTGDDTR